MGSIPTDSNWRRLVKSPACQGFLSAMWTQPRTTDNVSVVTPHASHLGSIVFPTFNVQQQLQKYQCMRTCVTCVMSIVFSLLQVHTNDSSCCSI